MDHHRMGRSFLVGSISIILLFACRPQPDDVPLGDSSLLDSIPDSLPEKLPESVEVVTDKPEKIAEYQPLFIKGSDFVIAPVGSYSPVKTYGRMMGNYFVLNRGKALSLNHGCQYQYQGDMKNIIFYNRTTEKYHLLTSSDLNIRKFFIYPKQQSRLPDNLIIYDVRSKSGTDDDYADLFISTDSGAQFLQLVKDGRRILDWNVYNERQALLMLLWRDTDQDKLMDKGDKIETVEVDLLNLSMGMFLMNYLSVHPVDP